MNGVARQHLCSFGCWLLGHLLLPVEICSLVHAQISFATIVAVNPQRITKSVHLNTLRWHSTVDFIVNKLIARRGDGLHVFSKCLQVGCRKFGGNVVATACFIVGRPFLAHCSCPCSCIDSNTCQRTFKMISAIQTQMSTMVKC